MFKNMFMMICIFLSVPHTKVCWHAGFPPLKPHVSQACSKSKGGLEGAQNVWASPPGNYKRGVDLYLKTLPKKNNKVKRWLSAKRMLVSGSILMWKKGSICISLPCRSNFIWAMLKFPGWWLVAVFRTTSRLGRVLWTVLIFSGWTFSHARWENRLSAAQANMCFWSFWQSIWDSHSYDFLCSKWNISMVPYGSRSPPSAFRPPQLPSFRAASETQPGRRHCECGQRQLGSHGLEDLVPSPGVAFVLMAGSLGAV